MKTSHYLTQINKKQTGCKMEIIQEKVNDVAIVEIKGRLDVTTASDLEQVFTKLLSENQNKVLVECRELEYISSGGLRV